MMKFIKEIITEILMASKVTSLKTCSVKGAYQPNLKDLED